jgi:hypothetical protein
VEAHVSQQQQGFKHRGGELRAEHRVVNASRGDPG